MNSWFFDEFLKMSVLPMFVINAGHLPPYAMDFEFDIFISIGPKLCTISHHSFVKLELLHFLRLFENNNFAHFRDKCTSSATVCDGFWIWYFIKIDPNTVHNSSSKFGDIGITLYWFFDKFLKMSILPIFLINAGHLLQYAMDFEFYKDRSKHCTQFLITVLLLIFLKNARM